MLVAGTREAGGLLFPAFGWLSAPTQCLVMDVSAYTCSNSAHWFCIRCWSDANSPAFHISPVTSHLLKAPHNKRRVVFQALIYPRCQLLAFIAPILLICVRIVLYDSWIIVVSLQFRAAAVNRKVICNYLGYWLFHLFLRHIFCGFILSHIRFRCFSLSYMKVNGIYMSLSIRNWGLLKAGIKCSLSFVLFLSYSLNCVELI